MGDIGILNTMLKINTNEIYLDKPFIYKGDIAENYVANQLIFNNVALYYWQQQVIQRLILLYIMRMVLYQSK